MDAAGAAVTPVFSVSSDMVPSSILRTWLPDHLPVFGDFTDAEGKHRIMSVQRGSRQPAVLTSNGAHEYQPAVSPDGRPLIFVSDRNGNPELYWQADAFSTTDQAIKLTEITGCDASHPAWLPDGSGIIYGSTCQDGNWEIYRASLTHHVVEAALTVVQPIAPQQVVRLTHATGDDRWPRVSPDGSQITFASNRDGNQEIYTMRIDGELEARVTNHDGRDEAPAWSPDGARLIFNSDRDGDHKIYSINRDGSSLIQLTNNTVDDGFAVWSQ